MVKLLFKVSCAHHDAATSACEFLCKLCLMIVHKFIVNDNEHTLAPGKRFGHSSSTSVRDDEIGSLEMLGKVRGVVESVDGGELIGCRE